ncbi:hypothetical protein KPL71_008174 [Citrus sinensis]|uniref:Uncharacterized protein n=1 Tax=Citrus sinensis TaxID=2711 RepID=A0ACB8M4Q7_CITSI|nr:hypothetical protein KPL71_008174 [Citrus sinensis]
MASTSSSPPVTLSSTLSLPKSCSSHTTNKIENLVEYSYIPESAQISESSYPLLSPYHLYKRPSSFTRSIRTLISTRRPHPKEYIQSSRLDQCSLQATPAEQYVTLEIPSELISNWKREGYTHLYLGGIRLILTLHGRKRLPVTARLAMLDTRFKQYQDAVIGTVLTTLHAGSVLLTFYPNFNLSLQDPNLPTTLKVQVQIQGAEQISSAKIATLHHQLVYRLQNHALDLPTPEHHSYTLMVLAESEQIPTIIQIPRQIPHHELIKLMPLEWISNYEQFHNNTAPIQTSESMFKRRQDGTVRMTFKPPPSAPQEPPRLSFTYSSMITSVQTAQEDLPIKGFNSEGYPVYPAKHNGHFLWDAPGSGMCDPTCPCWDDWEEDDDYVPRRKRKPKRKKPPVSCHHYDPKPPQDPPSPLAPLPYYQKELQWIAKHYRSETPSPIPLPTPPLTCMMFSSTSSDYSSSFPPLEPHTDSHRNVPRPVTFHIPGQHSPGHAPASPPVPSPPTESQPPSQSKDKQPMHQFSAHTVDHSSTTYDQTSDSNLAVSDSHTETDTESSVSTSDSEKSYADITRILMAQPDQPPPGQTSHTEPYVDIPSEVEEEMPESSATNQPLPAQAHTSSPSQKSSNGPWFTFDDLPSHKWRDRLNEMSTWIDLQMLRPGATTQSVLREFATRFTGALRDWFDSLGNYRQLQFVQLPEVSSALAVIHDQFLGDPSAVFEAARQDYLNMKCCSLNAKDFDFHYKRMSLLFYKLNGFNEPTLKHIKCKQKKDCDCSPKKKRHFKKFRNPEFSSRPRRSRQPYRFFRKKSSSSRDFKRRKSSRCFICKKKGHYAKDCPHKREKSIRLVEHLQATTDYSPEKDELEFYFSEQDEPNDETVFTLQNSSNDSDSDQSQIIFHQQLLSLDTTIPIPSIKLQILPSKFQRPIPAIGLIDTGAQRSMLNPHLLPPEDWKDYEEHFKAANGKLFTTSLITKKPIGIQIFPNCVIWTKVIGSTLPNKDLLLGFDILHQIKHLQILPNGIRVKSMFKPFTDILKLYNLSETPQPYQDISNKLLSFCPESHSEFTIQTHCGKIRSHDEHRQLLTQFYDIVHSHGIMLSAKKSTIATDNIEFLGMNIKNGHYQQGTHIAQELLHFPDQHFSKRQVQQFLGIINYIRDFIPHVDHYTHHLSALLKKNLPEWNTDHTNAVTTLKQIAQNPPPLKLITDGKRILQTDASDDSWGAILLEEINGKEHFIAYASGQFSDTQKHYHSVFKEILAVKNGIKKFEYHLIGHHFLIRMDSSAFPNILNFKGKTVPEKMLLRLKDWFSKYDFSVKHIKGSQNLIPDMLSRLSKPAKPLTLFSTTYHFPIISMATSLPLEALTKKTFPFNKPFLLSLPSRSLQEKLSFASS